MVTITYAPIGEFSFTTGPINSVRQQRPHPGRLYPFILRACSAVTDVMRPSPDMSIIYGIWS
jgi:hypothetical protein